MTPSLPEWAPAPMPTSGSTRSSVRCCGASPGSSGRRGEAQCPSRRHVHQARPVGVLTTSPSATAEKTGSVHDALDLFGGGLGQRHEPQPAASADDEYAVGGDDAGARCAQVPRQAQHPLAVWDVGQDAVDERSALLVHAAHPAARADRASFAREGDEQVVAAPVAVKSTEAVRQHPAAQVATQGLEHVAKQRPRAALVELAQERAELLAHRPVQHRVLGRAPPAVAPAVQAQTERPLMGSGPSSARRAPTRRARPARDPARPDSTSRWWPPRGPQAHDGP